jgi:hypothetical protein
LKEGIEAMIDYIEWHIPFHVLKARFYGDITLADMQDYDVQLIGFLQEALEKNPRQKIHLVVDGLEITSMLPLYKMLPMGVKVMQYKNRGLAIMATKNNRVRTIFEITSHILRKSNFQIRFVSSEAEAFQVLDSILAKEAST